MPKPVGDGDLTRLEHLRGLLPRERVTTPPRLLLFSRNGFTQELRTTAASRADVRLINLDHLYHGD